jgi:hypothetical protein
MSNHPTRPCRDLPQGPAVDRRAVVRGGLAATAAAAFAIAAGGPAEAQTAKITKAAAQYQTSPNGEQRCGTCTHYRFPFACERVEGAVSLRGWCRLYAPRA